MTSLRGFIARLKPPNPRFNYILRIPKWHQLKMRRRFVFIYPTFPYFTGPESNTVRGWPDFFSCQ